MAVSAGSKRAHSPRNAPAKRAKAAQACLSCRKHKTRCEMLDGDNSGAQCHRCKVLSLPCSFEENGAPSSDRAGSSSRPVHTPDVRSIREREDRRPSLALSQKSLDIPMDDPRAHPGPSYSRNWDSTSNTLPPLPRSQPQEEEVDLLDPQRLLPERHKPWGFLKLPGGFDGTMVPMLAMQALTRAGSVDDSSRNKLDQSLLHILGKEQIDYLTDIFEERYAPWLNLQPSQQPEGSLLRLAQCCVASRHLGSSTRSVVSPQLYRLADESIFKQAYHPLPSTDAIHAMLALSLWQPIEDSTKESRDGRLIASTAVSMAMNLRLSEAMVYSKTLRKQKKPDELPSAELIEAIDKARLWFALNNVESMLCVGTGRSPISDCDSLIYDAIDTTSMATIGAGRDMRLTLISQMFAATQYGLSIRLRSGEEIGEFYKEVLDFLMRMDVIERLIYPLPVLAEHEVFFFTMLRVYYQACRLLVLVHALIETKTVISKCDQQNPWFLVAEHNGINLGRSWGHQALVLSEGILITALSRPELVLLSAAPDNFFSMLTLATFFVIISKWSVMENACEQLPGSSDSILARTIDRMQQVSASLDHVPAKCARVIEAGVLSFRKRASEKSEAESRELHRPLLEHFDTAARNFRERVSAPVAHSGYPTEQQQYSHTQQSFPSFPVNDPNYFMNSDIILDNDFWSSFMSNLSDVKGR